MTETAAVLIDSHGGPEVLKWGRRTLPTPGPHDVCVKHAAVGLNYIDVYHRTGAYPMTLPGVLGYEATGVVESVGSAVRGFGVGDRVAYATAPLGAYSEHHIVPEDRLVALPDDITDMQAAAIMLQGLTAQYLLRRTCQVEAGDTILIHAAAGGVGVLLSQWASHLGARVIGTVGSKQKGALAKARGCSDVIFYREDSVPERIRDLTDRRGVRVVYDSVGADTLLDSLDCLQPLGMLVSFGNASGPPPPLDVGSLGPKGSLFVTRPSLFHYMQPASVLRDAAAELFEVVRSGVVKIEIGQTFPLHDAATAHRELEARNTVGATVLTI